MRPEAKDHETIQDTQPIHGDARDAVIGPVGSARLVEPTTLEPTTAEALSADLDRLTPIDNALSPELDRVTPIDDIEPAVPEAPAGLATVR